PGDDARRQPLRLSQRAVNHGPARLFKDVPELLLGAIRDARRQETWRHAEALGEELEGFGRRLSAPRLDLADVARRVSGPGQCGLGEARFLPEVLHPGR